MKLYLVQTGEAVRGETADFDRPLSDKGRINVEKLASFLSTGNLQARKVIHSGNRRAQQTLEILEWATSPARHKIEAREGLSPNDPVAPWVEEVSRWDEDAVIVGHQPFLGRLAAKLLSGREEPEVVEFVPGTAVCLERGPTGWSVTWMIPPGLISKIA